MARRLHQTLGDYIVIGVSPALIMTMIGSLVFFLTAVFYQGHFEARLHWVLGLFVMGAVLIGRISMEQGREHASLFALPLGAVSIAAMIRFVEAGWFANCLLLALIWWCADKLTWDCTWIDESEDASGEGLLQRAGLDDSPAEEPLEVSGPDAPAPAAPRDSQPRAWWRRFAERRRRGHAPGVWVIYFSLAALPAFGFGQRLVPMDARGYTFRLFVVYAASASGLLLTTSFLGLRRYLRQRRLEMPADMGGLWLGIGAVMIVALLSLVAFLPRPGGLVSAESAARLASAVQRRVSRWSVGGEGVGVEEGASRTREAKPNEQAHSQSSGAEPKSSGAESGTQQNQDGDRSGQPKSGAGGRESQNRHSQDGNRNARREGRSEQKRGGREGGDGKPGGASPQDSTGDRSAKRSPAETPPSNTDAPNHEARTPAKPSGQDRHDKAGQGGEARARQTGAKRPAGQDRASSSGRSPTHFGRNLVPLLSSGLQNILKAAFYLALIAAAVALLWRYSGEFRVALRGLLERFRELWQRWFGAGRESLEAAGEPEPAGPQAAVRPLAHYRDPFLSGKADRCSPSELVKYSFEALEAWAREQEVPREAEQTPLEFAQRLGQSHVLLARDAQNLAALYSQVAYASTPLPDSSVDYVRRFWRRLAEVQTASEEKVC